jgi:hypothetical protein
MLSSIHPLGERSRNNRWVITATAFVLASVAGSMTAGGLMGLLGALVELAFDPSPAVRVTAVVVVLVAAMALDLGLAGLRIPTIHRQVNENWLTAYRGWVYGLGFGFQLGLGAVTIVTTAAVYAWLAISFLSGSVAIGLAIGAMFGLGRGLAILPAAGIDDPGKLRAFHRRLGRNGQVAARLTPIAEAVVAAGALAMIVVVG